MAISSAARSNLPIQRASVLFPLCLNIQKKPSLLRNLPLGLLPETLTSSFTKRQGHWVPCTPPWSRHSAYAGPYTCVRAQSLSCVRLSATPWTVACQAPLPMGFPGRNTGMVAISSSRGSSQPRDCTCVSCIGRWILYHQATWEGPDLTHVCLLCSRAKNQYFSST